MHGAVKHLLNFGHFFESVGIVVKAGLIRKELVLEAWSDIIVAGWTQFEPVTAIFRRTQDPLAYEAFEYLTVLARRWQNEHPNGSFPKNVPPDQPRDRRLGKGPTQPAHLRIPNHVLG